MHKTFNPLICIIKLNCTYTMLENWIRKVGYIKKLSKIMNWADKPCRNVIRVCTSWWSIRWTAWNRMREWRNGSLSGYCWKSSIALPHNTNAWNTSSPPPQDEPQRADRYPDSGASGSQPRLEQKWRGGTNGMEKALSPLSFILGSVHSVYKL